MGRAMNLTLLRAHCLAKQGATEGHPFGPGVLVMKVGGKIFAIIGEDDQPISISLKCEPEIAIFLRDAYPAVQPGYHLSKRHWNTITIDGSIDDRIILDWVDDSYDLVVDGLSRQVRAQIFGAG